MKVTAARAAVRVVGDAAVGARAADYRRRADGQAGCDGIFNLAAEK